MVTDDPDTASYGTGDSFELSTEVAGEVFTAPPEFVLGLDDDTTRVAELSGNPVHGALTAFEDGRAYDLPHWFLPRRRRPDDEAARRRGGAVLPTPAGTAAPAEGARPRDRPRRGPGPRPGATP